MVADDSYLALNLGRLIACVDLFKIAIVRGNNEKGMRLIYVRFAAAIALYGQG